MSKSSCSFKQLSFSNLFNTYISDFESLSDYYSVNPFEDSEVLEKVRITKSFTDRKELVEALKAYHEYLGIDGNQTEALKKFSDSNSKVIVTGQQLGLLGGPLFTIYKTISAIILSRKLEKSSGEKIVPVFWLADEDHDYDEINSVGIPTYDALLTESTIEDESGKAVSEIEIAEEISELFDSLTDLLPETDFSASLFEMLRECYKPGKTHVQAFAKLISKIFEGTGLLIVGSNFKSIKELGKNVFINATKYSGNIYSCLEDQSSRLEDNFHRQVMVNESNLFFFNEERQRIKIDISDGKWIIEGKEFSSDDLINKIEDEPSSFSPNVFLRPVLQDYLLPTIGYVAGPGELAYYGQMKELYPQFDMNMPVIFPRLSISVIESNIDRIMEKLPFSLCQYSQRIEDLESAFVEQSNTLDIEGEFKNWKEEIERVSEKPTEFVKKVDPTLEGSAASVITGFENELNKLKGKVYRAVKQQEQTQLDRIAKIQSQLFPDGLQERSVSPVYFMNKYGLDVWEKMLEHYDNSQTEFTHHHIYRI